MAAAAVSSIVDEHLGFTKFGDFRRRWEPHTQRHARRWQLTATRVTAVKCSLSVAILREDQGPIVGFNRHQTLHGLSPSQDTPVNALRALMLATSAARELQFTVADEWMAHTKLSLPPQRSVGRPANPPASDRGSVDPDG